ncbi:UDP-2,3-diacylglucosamine hydrolase [Paraperlucidibaca baekdonensis]|uniref:UDP-2,3-diacylglucosamine hydrolase n=1 Tax=Paraperlucidibaca baekdonensis TaxID=748120 RepID=A0A3E0H6M4_9GAMM|nr:UDP-2,3-diacylglucosamine diphosphatase [Paraperlucidibaca baekdonensis]REH39099.1 UDP-2,3-diacylglucosamine hydrolase [Paraperlucidibaca baekdonensis]
MSQTLLVSDVHISADLTRVNAGFIGLLDALPADCQRVIVLGDLFEVWVGDDFSSTTLSAVEAAFSRLSQRGVDLLFCHGNRDFLIDAGPAGAKPFTERVGGRLLAEAEVMDLHGTPVLLMHGDQLCIDDEAYMAFRAQSRSEAWQHGILSQPLEQRVQIAEFWRLQSQAANSNKPENIMDVNDAEVVRVLTEAAVTTLVHGHTHRPQQHKHVLADGRDASRFVLGDWRESEGSAVIAWANDSGVHLQDYRF